MRKYARPLSRDATSDMAALCMYHLPEKVGISRGNQCDGPVLLTILRDDDPELRSVDSALSHFCAARCKLAGSFYCRSSLYYPRSASPDGLDGAITSFTIFLLAARGSGHSPCVL